MTQKFQAFCQALLSREVPGIQCFPVAQPDGGRNALFWLDVLGSNEPKVFDSHTEQKSGLWIPALRPQPDPEQ